MTTTIEITRVEDLQPGDVATFSYKGHEFTGEVWMSNDGLLNIGQTFITGPSGRINKFVRATRPAPPLPTTPGSVIEAANGTAIQGHFWMLIEHNGDRPWVCDHGMWASHKGLRLIRVIHDAGAEA